MNMTRIFNFYVFTFSRWQAINSYAKIIEQSIISKNKKSFTIKTFYKFNIKILIDFLLNILVLWLRGVKDNSLDRNIFIFGSFSLINIFLCFLLSKVGFKTVFCIHDVNAHSGARLKTFLTNFLTKLIFLSDAKIILFSKYSSILLRSKFPLKKIDFHIIPLFSFLEESLLYKKLINKVDSDNSQIIIFGRNEPYKGFNYIFNQACKISEKLQYKWLFIGSGMSKLVEKSSFNSKSIIINDCYYSIEELIKNLIKSSLTIIAYEEMTQSGIIFDSMALGLDIYSLNYPFIDEVKNYPGLTIFSKKEFIFESLKDYKPISKERRLYSINYYKENFSKDKVRLESNALIDSLIKK